MGIADIFSGLLNAADYPGSVARDYFAGEDWSDQSVFGGENRISGRELARRKGWAGRDDNWKNMLGGMAVEVATDPITWGSLGLGAVAGGLKAANLAKAAAATSKAKRAYDVATSPLAWPLEAAGAAKRALKPHDTLEQLAATPLKRRTFLKGMAAAAANAALPGSPEVIAKVNPATVGDLIKYASLSRPHMMDYESAAQSLSDDVIASLIGAPSPKIIKNTVAPGGDFLDSSSRAKAIADFVTGYDEGAIDVSKMTVKDQQAVINALKEISSNFANQLNRGTSHIFPDERELLGKTKAAAREFQDWVRASFGRDVVSVDDDLRAVKESTRKRAIARANKAAERMRKYEMQDIAKEFQNAGSQPRSESPRLPHDPLAPRTTVPGHQLLSVLPPPPGAQETPPLLTVLAEMDKYLPAATRNTPLHNAIKNLPDVVPSKNVVGMLRQAGLDPAQVNVAAIRAAVRGRKSISREELLRVADEVPAAAKAVSAYPDVPRYSRLSRALDKLPADKRMTSPELVEWARKAGVSEDELKFGVDWDTPDEILTRDQWKSQLKDPGIGMVEKAEFDTALDKMEREYDALDYEGKRKYPARQVLTNARKIRRDAQFADLRVSETLNKIKSVDDDSVKYSTIVDLKTGNLDDVVRGHTGDLNSLAYKVVEFLQRNKRSAAYTGGRAEEDAAAVIAMKLVSDGMPRKEAAVKAAEILANKRLSSIPGASEPHFREIREAASMVLDNMKAGESGAKAQYKQYSLPGGSNYFERLFTHPAAEREAHWGAPVISHQRGKIHELPGGGKARVLHEVQSARHQGYEKSVAKARKTLRDWEQSLELAQAGKVDEAREKIARYVGDEQADYLARNPGSYNLDTVRRYSDKDVSRVLQEARKVPHYDSWERRNLEQLLIEAARDPEITHAGWITGEDMSRWATGNAGVIEDLDNMRGLQTHADELMVNEMNKVLRDKLGAKAPEVTSGRIVAEQGKVSDAIDSLKAIMDAVSMDLGATPEQESAATNYVASFARQVGVEPDDMFDALSSGVTTNRGIQRMRQIEKKIEDFYKSQGAGRPAWLVEMTPELREAAKKGFPLLALMAMAGVPAMATQDQQ